MPFWSLTHPPWIISMAWFSCRFLKVMVFMRMHWRHFNDGFSCEIQKRYGFLADCSIYQLPRSMGSPTVVSVICLSALPTWLISTFKDAGGSQMTQSGQCCYHLEMGHATYSWVSNKSGGSNKSSGWKKDIFFIRAVVSNKRVSWKSWSLPVQLH